MDSDTRKDEGTYCDACGGGAATAAQPSFRRLLRTANACSSETVIVSGYVDMSHVSCPMALAASDQFCTIMERVGNALPATATCDVVACQNDVGGSGDEEAAVKLSIEFEVTVPDEVKVRAAFARAQQDALIYAEAVNVVGGLTRDDVVRSALLNAEIDRIVIYPATYVPTAGMTYAPSVSP
jgi:hypothetical protein